MLPSLQKLLFDFFTVSNAIENINDNDEAQAQEEFFLQNLDTPLEELMYSFHSKMNYLNDYCVAGRLRTYPVYVGSCEGHKHEEIADDLCLLFERKPTTWEEIKQWHIDFEHIHPFGDGNGRVGRMLMLRQVWDANIEMPLMFRSMENFEENRREYYKWF